MKRHSFKPELEVLDARDVPSVNYWRGTVDSNFDNYANWSLNVVPSAGDDIVFQPLVIYTDEGPVTSVVSCSGMHAPDGGGEYNSVTLEIGYSAVVGLAGGFSTGALWIADGSLDQGSPSSPWTDTDITVTGTEIVTYENQIILNSMPADFYWTGGTLNGTSNVATVTITGSTSGLIAPANAGTVDLGSSITLDDGSTVTMGRGTINLLNDGIDFSVYQNCSLLVDPGQGNRLDVTFSQGNTTRGRLNTISQGGVIEVKSGFWNETGQSLINWSGGTFIMDAGTHAYFGAPIIRFRWVPVQDSILTAGVEYFAADATLESNNRIHKTAGTIVIKSGAKPEGFTGNIVGVLWIEFGDVSFQSLAQGDNHEFGEFLVDGPVTWDSGTYRPFVSSETGGGNDIWTATGTFKFGANAALVATAVDGENNIVTPDSGMTWLILEAYGGFVNNNAPTYDHNTWALDPDNINNPTRGWWLRKT